MNAKSVFEKPKTEKEKSIDYIYKLFELFKDLDDCSVDLLKMYITNFTLEKAELMKIKEPHKYAEEMQKIEDLLEEQRKSKNDPNKLKKLKPALVDKNIKFATDLFHKRKKYFVFQFEEFLLVLLRFLRFVIGMQAKLEFFENQEVFVNLFLHKKALPVIADSLKYELQLKPYADQFRVFMKKKFAKKGKRKLRFKEEKEILVKMLKKNETFDELNHEDQAKFPPYFAFDVHHISKFRKYWNDDDFHLCYKDVEFRRYNDISKEQLFIDVDLHNEEEGQDNNNTNEEGEKSKTQKIEKKIKDFIEFEYKDDEDAICKELFYF